MVQGQPGQLLSEPTGGAAPQTSDPVSADVGAVRHRAAVVGSPIAHSLSPVLHRAAYRALGLDDWSYEIREVGPGRLAEVVAGLSPQWAGLSVTMPAKQEALALADEVGEAASLAGAANTLTRGAQGWRADNTDVVGLVRALREAARAADPAPAGASGWTPEHAVLIGSGATARSALVALRDLGVRQVDLVVRDRARPQTLALAERLGLSARQLRYDAGMAAWGEPDVVVSTVPAGAVPPVDEPGGLTSAVVLDVVYAGWPSPWALALAAHHVTVESGGLMLLHQAGEQVRLMTGLEPPVEEMRQALAATGALAGPAAGQGSAP